LIIKTKTLDPRIREDDKKSKFEKEKGKTKMIEQSLIFKPCAIGLPFICAISLRLSVSSGITP
jgi:hypothetical protein